MERNGNSTVYAMLFSLSILFAIAPTWKIERSRKPWGLNVIVDRTLVEKHSFKGNRRETKFVRFTENSTDFQFTPLTGIVEINVELTNQSDVYETLLGSLKRLFSSDRCNNDGEYLLTEYLFEKERINF